MSKVTFRSHTVPVFIVLLCFLSLGLIIPWLGLYWDDWPVMLASRVQGLGVFWDFYRGERPFSAWTYLTFIPLLGTRPWVWHVFSLFLRDLTVVGFWASLNGLWPRRIFENTLATALFAVYPVFIQQPVAVAFSQHWICYVLYIFSLWAMIQAARQAKFFWLWTLVGVLAASLHMLTMEYFWGLELVRPAVLWFLSDPASPATRQRVRRTFGMWLPYLAILAGVVIWRMFFMEIVEQDPNTPQLLYNLGSSPFSTLAHLAQVGLQDFIHNTFGAWFATLDPAEIDFSDRPVLFSWGIAALTASLSGWYLFHLRTDVEAETKVSSASSTSSDGWRYQALVLGLLATFLGPLPVWLKARQALIGLYSSRFALAAMFGLAILVVVFLDWLTARRKVQIILVASLLGLASGYHVRVATGYYRSTLRQNDFYWQLYWRAPQIEPGTAVLSADELFLYVGRASTAVALNLLYPQPEAYRGTYQVGYWFLELDHDVGDAQVPKLARGKLLARTFRTFNFSGSSLDSLVVYYKPGAGRCLWVLAPQDQDNPEIPALTRAALPVSNLGRIQPGPAKPGYPPTDLFGAEPAHTWCYFYQKAELARQQGNWQAVMQLDQEARLLNQKAQNAYELTAFIEAFLQMGRWQDAVQYSQEALALENEIAPRLCRLWKAAPGEAPEKIWDDLQSQLNCVQP